MITLYAGLVTVVVQKEIIRLHKVASTDTPTLGAGHSTVSDLILHITIVKTCKLSPIPVNSEHIAPSRGLGRDKDIASIVRK